MSLMRRDFAALSVSGDKIINLGTLLLLVTKTSIDHR